MEGDRITAKAGEPFSLAVQMEGDKLTFIPVGETADVQENQTPQVMQARSAETGDEGNLAGWLLALLISGCLAAGIVISYRKRNGNS